jgi:ATP-dependent DNA helicase RecQ
MNTGVDTASLPEVLQKYWGYDSFLPQQEPAMNSVLQARDSVVVLPTGGGKSLCFQAPAMCLPGMAVVVSPLISLMKDQVDGLRACGVPAAYINSSLSPDEKRQVANDIRGGRLKLLYVAPERLVTERTLAFLKEANVSLIAVDEAHCISAWGHDFRPEYRELRRLKDAFPNVGIHAYTATASEQVRDDIARELRLTEPEMLVGSFDRPNLIYKVQRRNDAIRQIREVVDRHPKESGVIYCISRAEVDRTAGTLAELGYRALPYHAGMTDEARRRNQEAFIEEQVEIIVATVAFGMGIDKSNVRYVIHAGMPKSLENYQQESGRAGRDGLDAECHLLYSGGDFRTWSRMLADSEPNAREGAMRSLSAMYDFCTGVACRHRAIVRYFGQDLDGDSCRACDVCLDDLDTVDGALVIGQKIVSCVVRLEQRFGGDYTAMVLTGSQEQRIVSAGHNRLSTWGLLGDENKRTVRDWIEQLVAQDYLQRVGEYNILQVTPKGRSLLRGESEPRLLKPRPKARAETEKSKTASVSANSWEGVDRDLFDALRTLRGEKATERGLPAYMVFGDAALRDMARLRPSTPDNFLNVRGVGEKKCQDYGEEFIGCIVKHCREHELAMDVDLNQTPPPPPDRQRERERVIESLSAAERRAIELFEKGATVAEAAETMGRALSTTYGYLDKYLRSRGVTDPSPWVEADAIREIEEAVEHVGTAALQPIYEFLQERINYNDIRTVVACLRNRRQTP